MRNFYLRDADTGDRDGDGDEEGDCSGGGGCGDSVDFRGMQLHGVLRQSLRQLCGPLVWRFDTTVSL